MPMNAFDSLRGLRWIFLAILMGGLLVPPAANLRAQDSGQTLTKNYDSLGRLLLCHFESAPFPHPARAAGHDYHGEHFSAAEHYSDNTVALFVPNGFRTGDQVDFVIHFHGWRNTVAGTLNQYHPVEQFVVSGRNAILIVPEGPRVAPDSFGGKLEDTNGFARFMAEAMTTLKQAAVVTNPRAEIGRIILSGHSGGYEVMAAIVDHGGLSQHIREVWLFDALYAGDDQFAAWQKREHGRLLDIYTDHGGTRQETEGLMHALQIQKVALFSGEGGVATPDVLRTNRWVFLHSDLAHDEVFARRDTFKLFLQTSCLDSR